jgi:hypothetical protein
MLMLATGIYLLIFHLIFNTHYIVSVDDMGATNVIRNSTMCMQVDCLFVKRGIVNVI